MFRFQNTCSYMNIYVFPGKYDTYIYVYPGKYDCVNKNIRF